MTGPDRDNDDVDARFVPDGPRLVPTDRARGPWTPDSLHGGPVAAADFGNGIGAELDVATSVFINPDLTVHLMRPPEGEWVCLDARTRFGPPGTGLAESALWDTRGRIGRALQGLYIGRQP